MRRVLRLAVAVLAVTMLVAACGDDDSGGSDNTSFSVTADSFQFTPDTFSMPANTDVTITLTNASSVDEHEFVIMKLGSEITSEDEFAEEKVLTEAEAAPGETNTLVANLPPGTYQVICGLEGHFNSGMHGTLTVTG